MMNYNLKQAKVASQINNDILSIGERSEHSLHRVIKYMIDPKSIYHEKKISNKIVDICIDNKIYEIQTKAFHNLRSKLDVVLENYEVTIIYPCIINKKIVKFNENGEVISSKKSPKKGKPIDALFEFYKIKQYLDHPNLKFKIFCFNVDEYQQTIKPTYKNRRGKIRIDQVPNELLDVLDISNINDYLKIVPVINNKFTYKDFLKETKINKKHASYIFSVIKYLGIYIQVDKNGKEYIYEMEKSC